MGWVFCTACKRQYNNANNGSCRNRACKEFKPAVFAPPPLEGQHRSMPSPFVMAPSSPKPVLTKKPAKSSAGPAQKPALPPKSFSPPPPAASSSSSKASSASSSLPSPKPAAVTVSFRATNSGPPTKDYRQLGFTAWVPLTVQQSRNYLKMHLGGKLKLEDFPDLETLVEKGSLSVDPRVAEGETSSPLDLMRFIIAAKNRTRPTISTDLEESCGGYQGFIWTIHGKVTERKWNDAVPNMQIRPSGLWPKLFLDKPTLDEANMIAIQNKIGTLELTYLTTVPGDQIVACSKDGTSL